MEKNYHHGDLATSLIDAAIPILDSEGPNQLSLRQLARTAGVSHGAPAHHFGDKTGLLTQVAIRGHDLLTKALRAGVEHSAKQSIKTSLKAGQKARESAPMTELIEAGKAYVRFALAHRGYFSVMFQSELIDANNEEYLKARLASKQVLEECVLALKSHSDIPPHAVDATLTALWSQVHGFAVLWLAGNFGNPNNMAVFEATLDEMLISIEPKI